MTEGDFCIYVYVQCTFSALFNEDFSCWSCKCSRKSWQNKNYCLVTVLYPNHVKLNIHTNISENYYKVESLSIQYVTQYKALKIQILYYIHSLKTLYIL